MGSVREKNTKQISLNYHFKIFCDKGEKYNNFGPIAITRWKDVMDPVVSPQRDFQLNSSKFANELTAAL